MGADLSRSKRASLDQDRRLGALARYCVEGWRLQVGPPERLIPDQTLLGFLQRGQTILFRCTRPDCGRRVTPDIEAVVRAGYGHLRAALLHKALSCSHPLGCGLGRPIETYPRGVPLVSFLGEPDIMISVVCEGCGRAVTLSPPAVIDRLVAAGRGDASTGILELSKRVRGPCRNCSGSSFEAVVLRPRAPGSG